MISTKQLASGLRTLGVVTGDTVLVRAGLRGVGEIEGGPLGFLRALLEAVGQSGTIVSLAFTDSVFLRRPRMEDAFTPLKKSNAGALPNVMLQHPGRLRSTHPTCSYVAIGSAASRILNGHDETAGAYEPVRRIVALEGKCVLVGCVESSPGFTTSHLAEAELGLYKRIIFPQLNSSYYRTSSGELKLFRRRDLGLCSRSFYKFYAHYVARGILSTGMVGAAYSILAPARQAYEVDLDILKKNPRFNVCDSPDCFCCNAGRWDRLHCFPRYALRRLLRRPRA